MHQRSALARFTEAQLSAIWWECYYPAVRHRSISQENKDVFIKNVEGIRDGLYLPALQHDEMGMTLLHWASLLNQEALVKKILASESKEEKSINVDIRSHEVTELRNMTPLWIAAKFGHTSIVKILLEAKADPSLKAESFRIGVCTFESWGSAGTPISVAKTREIVKLLEQPTLQQYLANRSRDSREYKTTTSLAGFFPRNWGYDKLSKVEAVEAYQTALESKDCSAASLLQVKAAHPALGDGELGKIYSRSIKARK